MLTHAYMYTHFVMVNNVFPFLPSSTVIIKALVLQGQVISITVCFVLWEASASLSVRGLSSECDPLNGLWGPGHWLTGVSALMGLKDGIVCCRKSAKAPLPLSLPLHHRRPWYCCCQDWSLGHSHHCVRRIRGDGAANEVRGRKGARKELGKEGI